jgi:hypothetical protein
MITSGIREGLALFIPDAGVMEIRILKTSQKTVSGYFNNLSAAEQAVRAAMAKYNGSANFYATLNPAKPDVLARAANRLKPYADTTTADSEILRRRWLGVDLDPVRPKGVSSTEGELAAAVARREALVEWLAAKGLSPECSPAQGHTTACLPLPRSRTYQLRD